MVFSHSLMMALASFLYFYFSLTGILLHLGAKLEKIPSIQARKIYDVSFSRSTKKLEIRSTILYCSFLAIFSSFFVTLSRSQRVCFSISHFTLTFFVSFLIFELYYYWLHRILHTKHFFRYHHQHHLARVNYPLASLSFNFGEMLMTSTGLIGIPWISSYFLPFNLEGWIAYLIFNFIVTILGHLNYEATPDFYGRRPYNWLLHPILYHSIHHARFNKHYCFYLTFLDRIFGTEWNDWEQLHKQVIQGTPAKTLNTRG